MVSPKHNLALIGVSVAILCCVLPAALGVRAATTAAQTSLPERVNCEPYKALIHQSMGELFSSAELHLDEGEHTLELVNMTTGNTREEASLQVLFVTEDGRTQHADRVSWVDVPKEQPEEVLANATRNKTLTEEKLEALETQLRDILHKRAHAQHEAQLGQLQSSNINRVIESILTRIASPTTNLTDLQDALELLPKWEERRKSLLSVDYSLQQEQNQLGEEKLRVEREMATLRQQQQQSATIEVIRVAQVVLNVEKSGTLQVNTSMLIHKVGWEPSYDLRLDSTRGALSLTYNALVSQHSAREWKNIAVELCTGVPLEDRTGAVPGLSPLFVREYIPPPPPRRRTMSTMETTSETISLSATKAPTVSRTASYSATPAPTTATASMSVEVEGEVNFGRAKEEEPPVVLKKAAVVEGPKSATAATHSISDVFALSGLFSFAVGQQVRLPVVQQQLEANVSYIAVPVKAPKVFIRADARNSGPFTLLPGKAMLFVDGTYLTDSKLPLVGSQDTVTVDLGIDPRMQSSRQFRGNRKETIYHYFSTNEIVDEYRYVNRVTNKKPSKVFVKVRDVVPLSNSDTIKIELVDPPYPGHALYAPGSTPWLEKVASKKKSSGAGAGCTGLGSDSERKVPCAEDSMSKGTTGDDVVVLFSRTDAGGKPNAALGTEAPVHVVNATLNTHTGVVEWTVQVEPAETTDIPLRYRVTRNEDVQMEGL